MLISYIFIPCFFFIFLCIKGKLKKPKASSSGEEGSDQAVDKVPRKRRQAATVGGDKAMSDGLGNKRKRDAFQEEAALPILPIPLKVKKRSQKSKLI